MNFLKRGLAVCAALGLLAAPLQSKFGVGKTHAHFTMYHPPAFHTEGREIRVLVDSVDMRTGGMMVPRLQHFLEDSLTAQGFKLSPGAHTVLQCTLTDTTSALETVARSESVNVHTGEHTEEKNGKKKQVEDCKNQTAPVTYLVSSGHLAMDVKARNGQTVLYSQMVERAYHQESAVAGPPKCGGEAYVVQKGQLQDAYAILGQLGDQIVLDTTALVAGFDEMRDVYLAVDDELKPGNTQALAGAWPEAMASWTGASMRNTPGEAARQYNLGVGHEMMAGAAMHNWALDDAATHLTQAQKCYSQAIKTDPEEKYFRDTLARVQSDQALLDQQTKQAAMEPSESGGQLSQRTPPAGSSLSIPLEGWPAGETGPTHDFRVYARMRLAAVKGRPTDALRQELVASAGDYKVDSSTATSVVDSEAQRAAVVQGNMDRYRADYAAANANGPITSEVREMLRQRQKILHLSDDQVRAIESQFQSQNQ